MNLNQMELSVVKDAIEQTELNSLIELTEMHLAGVGGGIGETTL